MKTYNLARVVAALVSIAWLLPSAALAQTLTTEQARAAIAPFYQALNAGNDAVALVNQATSPIPGSRPSRDHSFSMRLTA